MKVCATRYKAFGEPFLLIILAVKWFPRKKAQKNSQTTDSGFTDRSL